MVRKQKEDFTNYMTSVLQNSMLTGIPQIATAGNIPKKVLRALVFILCLVGFIYQSLIFLYMYWEYETVIDVQVSSPEVIEVPSMTICTLHGVQLSRMCSDEKYKKKCSLLKDDEFIKWCECAPRYCEDPDEDDDVIELKLMNISVPSYYDMKDLFLVPYDDVKKYLQPIEEFISYCRFYLTNETVLDSVCDRSYYQNTRCTSLIESAIPSCFTINTRLGKPDAKQPEILSNGYMLLELDVNGKDYTNTFMKISTQISFHHSRTMNNPYIYGYTMYPTKKYIFRMKRVIHKRLPPPYETQCLDYFEMWKARGGQGPTNERECIEECQKNASLELNGCLENHFKVPSNDRRCKVGFRNPATLKIIQKCAKENCRPACYEEKYEVSTDEMDLDYSIDTCAFGPADPDRVQILVYFDGMETTVYEYSPKFQNIETFSYLGGYVGMWLGISLVAVFDFLETLVVIMKYPCKRYARFKAKRTQIENMRRAHRSY